MKSAERTLIELTLFLSLFTSWSSYSLLRNHKKRGEKKRLGKGGREEGEGRGRVEREGRREVGREGENEEDHRITSNKMSNAEKRKEKGRIWK